MRTRSLLCALGLRLKEPILLIRELDFLISLDIETGPHLVSRFAIILDPTALAGIFYEYLSYGEFRFGRNLEYSLNPERGFGDII